MKVLIVDDSGAIRRFLKALLKDSDFTCIEAESGEEALNLVEYHTDLCAVLMDVHMPGMDGLETTRRIKKDNRYLPVIFVTSVDDEETLAKCFGAGGDDFLTKPLNKTTLICRLNSHRRFYSLATSMSEKNRELIYHQKLIEREHSVVEHVFANVINPAMASLDFVKTYLSPMSTFSGDLYLASTNAVGSTYLFLGDFTGHGLSAAIGCMPVTDIFYAMSSKCASVGEIAEEANRKLLSILPDNMFCCAVIIELNAAQDYMRIWSGGMHDVLLVSSDNTVEGRIESQHMPLGVLSSGEFDKSAEVVPLAKGTRVIGFTDGVVEARGHNDEFFGEDNLCHAVEGADSPLDAILSAYQEFCPADAQEDDISIIELTAGVSDVLRLNHANKPNPRSKSMMFGDHKTGILPWNLTVKLNPSEFSRQGLINHVLGHMLAGGLEKEKQGNAFRIASELIDTRLLVLKPASTSNVTDVDFRSEEARVLAVAGAGVVYSGSDSQSIQNAKRLSIIELSNEFELNLSVSLDTVPVFSFDLSIQNCPCDDNADADRQGQDSVSFSDELEEIKFLSSLCRSLTVDNGCRIRAEVELLTENYQ